MDEIEKAFTDVSVADFLRDTSASIVTHLTEEAPAYIREGPAAFMSWVDLWIINIRKQASEDHEFMPIAILRSAEQMRIYYPDPDETVTNFANRLRREAQGMSAIWLFTAMLSYGRAYSEEDAPPAIQADEPGAIEAALERGEIEPAICWFAETCEQDALQRAGIIGFEDGMPTQGIEGEIDAAKNPFHHVLGEGIPL